MGSEISGQYLLEVKDINKRFPGVRALRDVSMGVRPGEVHGLLGENGAGKSTLIKIITGIYTKDSGEILFDGREIYPSTALEAQKLGISTIYQELNLSPFLSVAENIYLGREIRNKLGLIDWKRTNKEAHKRMLEMGIDIDVTVRLQRYSTAIQQMVSIARALLIDAKLIVMDEATSSLDEGEVEVLFKEIRRLKAMGISIIYITHRLEEIFAICDCATVLKDGESLGTHDIADLTRTKLISLMIGRDASQIINKKKQYDPKLGDAPVFMEVKDIRKGRVLKGIDLQVREGEIVGLAGLLGSGRTELSKIMYGDDQLYFGEIYIKGEKVQFKSPKDAILKGLAYCPEDRKEDGIFAIMSVMDNLTMTRLRSLVKGKILLDNKKQRALTDEYIQKLSIKTPSGRTTIRSLSGGNQQKVVLSRGLCTQPKMIILDEPTRGIDVGAKSEIEDLIQEMASEGIAVLFISSELQELVRGCDRIAVLYEGHKVEELIGDDISYDAIMASIAKGSEMSQARSLAAQQSEISQGQGGVSHG